MAYSTPVGIFDYLDAWVWVLIALLPVINAAVHHPTADTRTRVLLSIVGSIAAAIIQEGTFDPETWGAVAGAIWVAQYGAFKIEDGLLGKGRDLNDAVGETGFGAARYTEDY